jgi:glutaminyl-tRNA synthetase
MMSSTSASSTPATPHSSKEHNEARSHFIKKIIHLDIESGKHNGRVHTRFPPEPNGYLHVGHAKSICLNFGLAAEFNGACNLRLDDTNPEKEDTEYVEAIKNDINWLGFNWSGNALFASDYFEQLYDFAVELINAQKAYVCNLTAEEVREHRGTLTESGQESPYRNRSVSDNLDLFAQMRAGEFPDGSYTLRAKIDMSSGNINMRDPALYRIRHAHHHRTENAWVIYPMYDFAHGLSDALEGITHSICTLEFEDHRPLYDWLIDNVSAPHKPQQIEFARLNLTHTVVSKRKILRLVQEGTVDGWDDPRLPTLRGMRRRGFPAPAIRDFCERISVAKADSLVEFSMLEACVREHLNKHAVRAMAVLNPIKVTIINFPDGVVETIEVPNNPEDPSAGTRLVPFSKHILIEADDFSEKPPPKYFRLTPNKEVRLVNAYYITCNTVIKDKSGTVTELLCTYDPESKGGGTPDNRKVKGTLHWVSAPHALTAEVRLCEHLFTATQPEADEDFTKSLNPESLTIVHNCKVEPSLAACKPEDSFQFMRQGYFVADQHLFKPDKLVFNRIVGLRASFNK